jgi:protein TonB
MLHPRPDAMCRVALLARSFPVTLQNRINKPTAPKVSTEGTVVDLGPGITPPQSIFAPDPDYPVAVRKKKHPTQGTCVLELIVDEDGKPRDVHVTRSLTKLLDQNAIDAVRQWKFKPALRDGKPLAVRTSVEADYRLY